ncbi:MAG: beta-ketoacyl-ACP synthase II [Patescibacteria group bacterium]|nr:beta-ketoacyl-ACP synthase II [Patescibacteria group bacterium]
MKRRVVVTGMGLISSIGSSVDEVANALFRGRSGIVFCSEYAEMGMASHIAGNLPDPKEMIGNKRTTRFMSMGAAFAYLAMQQAINDSGLSEKDVSNSRTGLIVGTGGGSPADSVFVADTLRNKGFKKVLPTLVPRCMDSSPSANLSVLFSTKGVSFSIASACATSAHCIGEAWEKIVFGKQEVMFAGGSDEKDWIIASTFDRAGALSRRNDAPERASRPYDKDRDGFVMAGGGGVIVLEELNHALERNGEIHAEIIGYGTTSDGLSMTQPSEKGTARCMRQALEVASLNSKSVNYINTHGTSTPAGDIVELKAIKKVFGNNIPFISSTKSMTGHGLGAAGAHELIFSIIMMQRGFIAPSINIENLDTDAKNFPIITETMENYAPEIVMSNSFGFGGTNVTLIVKRYAN